MLTEAEFATHVNGYCQCGCTDPLIEHDRAQRAEIELLRDIIRRAAWLEQAPEEGSPYIDFESYARATEESEALRARAEKAEADLAAQIKAAEDDCHRWDEMERRIANAEAVLAHDREVSAFAFRIEEQKRIAADARADRYLAAMTAYVDARIADGICIAQDGESMPIAFERTELAIRAIRRLVEEARRG